MYWGGVPSVVGEGIPSVHVVGGWDSAHMGTPCKQTDTTENINTFPQTTYANGNN